MPQPSITVEDQIKDNIKVSVSNFVGIPRNIIESRAEQDAETWVSQNFDSDSPVRESYKNQYKEIFIEEVYNKLRI